MHTETIPRKHYVSPDQALAEAPRGSGITRWKNPTDAPMQFDLFLEPPLWSGPAGDTDRRCVRGSAWLRVAVAPGGECELPSVYDAAIQTIGRDEQIVSGMAPFLVRLTGASPAKVHPALLPPKTSLRRKGSA